MAQIDNPADVADEVTNEPEGHTKSSTAMHFVMNAITFPVTHVSKILMQVGYEPVAPAYGKSLLMRKTHLYYPNALSYINHIRKTDGLKMLYTGLTPRLLSLLTVYAVEQVTQVTIKKFFPYEATDAKDPPHLRSLAGAAHNMATDLYTRMFICVATQPLHVVMIRMIASIISKDEVYQGFFSSIREIYQNEGLAGFYSGIVPRCIAETLSVTGTCVGAWVIYKVLGCAGVDEDSVKMGPNYPAIVQYFVYGFTYPYFLVTTNIICSCRGLHIGLPLYPSWRNCFSDLRSTNRLFQGQNMFYRIAKG